MAPIYQEAHAQLLMYAETPRLVATGQATLLPSFPYCYVTHEAGLKSKGKRAHADMKRIYEVAISCERILELITAGIKAIAEEFFSHTREFQVGGCLAGENDTPELRAKLSGVNRTNTVVECVFALEKFLCTREKGSLLRGRKGWTLFKYNGTDVWGEQLDANKLKLCTRTCHVSRAIRSPHAMAADSSSCGGRLSTRARTGRRSWRLYAPSIARLLQSCCG